MVEDGDKTMKKLFIFFKLFNINYLILMCIQGLILIILDYNSFKKQKNFVLAKKSKYLGYGSIIIAFILFIIRKIIILF